MSSGNEPTSPLLQKADKKYGRYFEIIARPCLAEFFGAFLFVFVGCMSLQDGLTVQPPGTIYVPSATAVAIAHGLTITVLHMGFGHISGGHFNPAITLGAVISGGVSPILALGYFISQIIGGICGAAMCSGVLPDAVYEKIAGGANFLNKIDPGRAILVETVITSILVLIFIMVTVDESTQNKFAPLAIGFAVTVGILASINLTGGSMNPARSLGPAILVRLASDIDVFTNHYVYWVGPVLAAGVAALSYRFIFAPASKRWIFREV